MKSLLNKYNKKFRTNFNKYFHMWKIIYNTKKQILDPNFIRKMNLFYKEKNLYLNELRMKIGYINRNY